MTSINKKILIVEDEDSFLSILKNVFSLEGFSVFTAKDGEAGLSAAEKEKPDLVISDVLLPRLGGLDMAKKMKELKILAPVIFLTNVADEERDENFDYFTKSEMSIDEVVKKVKEKLGI